MPTIIDADPPCAPRERMGIADSISVGVKITTSMHQVHRTLACTQIYFHLHETLPFKSVAVNGNLKSAFPCGATWQLMAQLRHDVMT
jgi:hypothetical protein